MSQTYQYSKSMNGLLDIEATSVLTDNIVCQTLAVNQSGTTTTPLLTSNDTTIPNTSWVNSIVSNSSIMMPINSSTGLISGGLITPFLSNTFNLSAGTGNIIISGVNTAISWSAFSNITITYLASAEQTYIYITFAGAILQVPTTHPTDSAKRSNIYLGYIRHPNNTSILSIINEPAFIQSPANQVMDLYEAVGFLNISGNVISGNSGTLNITKSTGTISGAGINYLTDVTQPNLKSLASINTASVSFSYLTQNSYIDTGKNSITGDFYDVGGTKTATPTNKYTIQQVWILVDNRINVLYGQNLYGSLQDAKDNLFIENFVVETNTASNGVLICYLIIREGLTFFDPDHSFFLKVGKFGTSASPSINISNFMDLSTSQTVISGIKSYNVLPESTVTASSANQLTNLSTVNSLISTATSDVIRTTGNQTIISGIKSYNELPESTVTASSANQLTNLSTVNSTVSGYVPNKVNLGLTTATFGYITGYPLEVYAQIQGGGTFLSTTTTTLTPTAGTMIGYIYLANNTQDLLDFTITVNRSVYSAAGTVTFTGLTNEFIRIYRRSTGVIEYQSPTVLNVNQPMTLTFGVAEYPITVPKTYFKLLSGEVQGEYYDIYHYCGLNYTGGTCGVLYARTIFSSATYVLTSLDPTYKQGTTVADKLSCNIFTPKLISCNQNPAFGVFITNPGMTLMWMLNRSCINLATWTSQTTTSGVVPSTQYQSGIVPATPANQVYTNTTTAVNFTFFIVYPGWGLVTYSGVSYGGTIVSSFKNNTLTPILINPVGAKSSARVYYNDVQQG